jgi:hypothetical protein
VLKHGRFTSPFFVSKKNLEKFRSLKVNLLQTVLFTSSAVLGCQSATQAAQSPSVASEKATLSKASKTPDSRSGFVEIYTETKCSLKDCKPLERAVTLDPLVQSCLGASAKKNENSVKLALTGHLNGRGVVSTLHAKTSDKDLEVCVTQVLIKKAMTTSGPATDFKIQVESISTTDPRFGKVKTIPLDIDASHPQVLEKSLDKNLNKEPVKP